MKKILNKIKKDSELSRAIQDLSWYNEEDFIADARRYVKAVKEGRVIVTIPSVSSSGMSRTMTFNEVCKNIYSGKHQVLQFFDFFRALGYNVDRDGKFRVSGCGMDMVFHTNYSIMHRLHRLGIVNTEKLRVLCQATPHVL